MLENRAALTVWKCQIHLYTASRESRIESLTRAILPLRFLGEVLRNLLPSCCVFTIGTTERARMRSFQYSPPGGNTMANKFVLAMRLAISLAPAASLAQVVVRIGPPPPVAERRGPPPGSGFVWIGGYHRWDGGRYVWTPGRWERPPHPGAEDVP